jgi:mitochondrial fission protein ELM1
VKAINGSSLYNVLAPWGPVPFTEHFGESGSRFAPPWPTFAFATGRTTIPYIRALHRRAGLATYTVILMDPHTGPNSADLIWVPEHDRRWGANVLRTLAAPHRFPAARLETLRATMPAVIAALPRPRVACFIGGPNGDYRYTDASERRLIQSIKGFLAQGAGLMITSSRRTPKRLIERIRQSVGGKALFWDATNANLYPDFLAHADAFIISADSVSMTCEAAATGRPIYVFSPSRGSAKFKRFHAGLASYGATRPLPPPGQPLATWEYVPLHSAEIIAAEIARRWRRRVELLPGLVAQNAT